MKKAAIVSLAAVAFCAGFVIPVAATADGMFDIMNPGRWFGNDDDDWHRYGRWGGPYGYGPWGYGGPYGGYGPYGYGPYGGGYGPYGYPGAYGPGGSTIVVTPQGDSDKAAAPRVPE